MPTGLGGLISLTFHSMSLPGCKPRGPTHCQQINQPGEPEPACWGATNMDAALLDTCESAQDEDSEGILAQNPPRKALPPGAGCLSRSGDKGWGRELGWLSCWRVGTSTGSQLPSCHQPWGRGYLSQPACPACLLVYIW